ncbi:hypothetical protein H1R16_08655 [Marnyiella aurantia]|uniref:Tetratricopeptide repeat protein n=1 Tax=Marnyiella aurantia TaxID=2758037 RepID=A0A7D7QT56_9FLAO|nr:hypothetical protein [Marnyiella aurantia]MBA5246868.1 hypothetical protein [Marnyiella aurantia]QMS97787.1 hypothetical protein H1R16_08655 [Marnyiella aurantia]
MKKILLTFYLVAFATIVSAQGNYEKQMLENIGKMKTATTVQDFTDLRYNFASLAGNGNSHWQPYYYTALNCLKESQAYVKEGKSDAALDGPVTGLKYLLPVTKQQLNNVEFVALLGMLHAQKAALKNSEKDRQMAADYLAKALKLDANNPRAALLRAELKYHTSADKGGSKTEGVELYKEALKKFRTFKPKTKTDPNWGMEIAEYYASFSESVLTLLTR